MIMSEDTRVALNHLLGSFFGHNSEADNLAYCLADACYPAISATYHLKFAHFFTGDTMADGISDLMDQLDARPIREALPANDKDYAGDLGAIFADNEAMCERCRAAIIKVIELADVNNDYEVKIWGEDLLMKFMPYYKQARVWRTFAERYKENYTQFNMKFDQITTYID